MSDLTEQDRRDYAEVERVLTQMQRYVSNATGYNGHPAEWLRDLRAVFPAPAPTLSEELRELGSLLEEEGGAGAKSTCWARDLATRAEQIEQERDEARAEVERLTAERDDATVAREENVAPDQQANTQETLSGSLPDPDDVPYGEAWLVEVDGGTVPAIKAGRRRWVYPGAGGYWNSPVVGDWFTLVSRLVPAPRTITTREELDALPRCTVIRDADGITCERARSSETWYCPLEDCDQTPFIALPAMVLWTPEAAA